MTASSETSPYSHLKVGSRGRVNGIDIHLLGYIRNTASDDEDTWYWEEWYCGIIDGSEIWIEYDEETEKYSLFKKLPDVHPLTNNDGSFGRHIELSSKDAFTVKEVAVAKIIHSSGQLPEGHELDTQFTYYEGAKYTVEVSDETEVFKTEHINPLELFKALELHGAVAKFEWKAEQKRIWDFGRIVTFAVAAASLALMFLGSVNARTAFEQSFTTCTAKTNGSCTAEQIIFGPITLDKKNRAHKIELKSLNGISQQNWQAATITLLNKDQQPLSAIEGDFWEERWVEGGESGIESNKSASKYFRLTEPGEYYLHLDVSPVSPTTMPAQFGPITLKIKILENVLYWPYFTTLLTSSIGLVGMKDKWYRRFGD